LELSDWSRALKQHGVAVEEWRDNWPQNCEQATSIRDVKRRWQSCRDRHLTSLHHSENEKGETRCVALLFLEVAITKDTCSFRRLRWITHSRINTVADDWQQALAEWAVRSVKVVSIAINIFRRIPWNPVWEGIDSPYDFSCNLPE